MYWSHYRPLTLIRVQLKHPRQTNAAPVHYLYYNMLACTFSNFSPPEDTVDESVRNIKHHDRYSKGVVHLKRLKLPVTVIPRALTEAIL